MRISQLITVVIRILALRFILYTSEFLLRLLGKQDYHTVDSFDYAQLVLYIVCAILLWWGSSFFARFLTHGQDASLDAPNLVLDDLYRFAFLLVGLYFTVESLGPTLSRFHYAVVRSSTPSGLTPEQRVNFYLFFRELITLLIGLTLTMNARKLAVRLIKHQNKDGRPQ